MLYDNQTTNSVIGRIGKQWIDSLLSIHNPCDWMGEMMDYDGDGDDDEYSGNYYDDNDDSYTSLLGGQSEDGDSYNGYDLLTNDLDGKDEIPTSNNNIPESEKRSSCSRRKSEKKKKCDTTNTQKLEAVTEEKMTTNKYESDTFDLYNVTVITKNRINAAAASLPLLKVISLSNSENSDSTFDQQILVSDTTTNVQRYSKYSVCNTTTLCKGILKNKERKNKKIEKQDLSFPIHSSHFLLATSESSVAKNDDKARNHKELDNLVSEIESNQFSFPSSVSFLSPLAGVIRRMKGSNHSRSTKKDNDYENQANMDKDSYSNSTKSTFNKTLERKVSFWDGYKKKEGNENEIDDKKSSTSTKEMFTLRCIFIIITALLLLLCISSLHSFFLSNNIYIISLSVLLLQKGTKKVMKLTLLNSKF